MRKPLLNLSAVVAVSGICAVGIWTAAGSEPTVHASNQGGVAPPAAVGQAVPRFAHVVDLTHALNENTPYIPVPGITFPFKKTLIATISKNGVAAYRWDIHEHIGTQIDAPSHFFDDGLSLELLPVASLVVPLVVIDVFKRASSNPDTPPVSLTPVDFYSKHHQDWTSSTRQHLSPIDSEHDRGARFESIARAAPYVMARQGAGHEPEGSKRRQSPIAQTYRHRHLQSCGLHDDGLAGRLLVE